LPQRNFGQLKEGLSWLPKQGTNRFLHTFAPQKVTSLKERARNTSATGTLRDNRWPAIVKYVGTPNGIALAKAEAGITKRHLYKLERDGQLVFDPSPRNVANQRRRTTVVPANYAGMLPKRIHAFSNTLYTSMASKRR
jgi:hypothetical protein